MPPARIYLEESSIVVYARDAHAEIDCEGFGGGLGVRGPGGGGELSVGKM
jgi:hypothetical protein